MRLIRISCGLALLAVTAVVLSPPSAGAGVLPWVILKGDDYTRKFRELNCLPKGPPQSAKREAIVLSGKTPKNLRLQVLARETPAVPGTLRIWNGNRGKRGGISGSVTKVRIWGNDPAYLKMRVEGRFTAGRSGTFTITGRCGCKGGCNGIPDDGDGARAAVAAQRPSGGS
jgi:hypothetical protein